MAKHTAAIAGLMILTFLLFLQPVSAADFKFDIVAKVSGSDNYTRHWSNIYPPDSKADIIIHSAAYDVAYRRMSDLNFLYVVYDPMGNVVALGNQEKFQRSYDPVVAYYTIHPASDWIEGNYRVRIQVYDRINRQALDNFTNDLTGDQSVIMDDPGTYKTFFETGSNAGDKGVLASPGTLTAQADLNFKISKSATIYPPDRFVLHDARFTDNTNERIIGELFKVEVKIDNNYKDDGTVKLAMLVDNNIVSTKDVAVKGFSTSTVIFDAKAGKEGTFKLHFGTDTPDVKYKNAELTFSIKNEAESTKLDIPKIEIKGMNVDKEFVSAGENTTVSVTASNNGKTGSKTITVYSNNVPVGSTEVQLQYLEEKTVQVPIILKNTGINRITVSDAPSLFRNVFVQEPESPLTKNPIVKRLQDNPLKVSMIVVFMVFAGVLYSVRKRLLEDEVRTHAKRREPGNDQKTLDDVETPAEYKPKLSDMGKYLKSFGERIKLRFKPKALAIPPEQLQQQEDVEKPSEVLVKTYKQIVRPSKKSKSSKKLRPEHEKKMRTKGNG
ncbi:MAG: hypothetical protein O8C62_09435 [Candidatus Methanoperedens sp.]|nr:hypothetical protein [Candidatus Methanoperedens sp.]